MIELTLALIALALSPLAGGLVSGIDRKITARMQSRFGPPILQPFYDVLKLIGKSPMNANPWLIFCSYMYIVSSALAVFLFFLQSDLLLIFFVMTVGAVFQVIGALSVQSPFSQVGAQRELLQMLTYEPLIIVTFVGIAMKTGNFGIDAVYAQSEPLLYSMPLLFLVLGTALTIKLRKSPFDIAASHHGHQEIVRGILTEYSGPQLALLEIGHWLDVVLMLCLISLFWSTSVVGALILVGITYFAELIIDNISARMTWHWMLQNALGIGMALALVNILWLYAIK